MKKDNIFQDSTTAPCTFSFDNKVAEVFDDMLARSVPNYRQVIIMTGQILGHFLKPGDLVCDLGCSTGHCLIALAQQLRDRQLNYLGLDNSVAMIGKARLKAEMYGQDKNINFTRADILSAQIPTCGAIILNYTLQFIRPLQRQEFLQKIYAALKPGGVLILAEKIISPQNDLNEIFTTNYHDFKREQGYSELEISRKREALENILIPFSISENINLLTSAGFSHCETFCQWYNFAALVAVKKTHHEFLPR